MMTKVGVCGGSRALLGSAGSLLGQAQETIGKSFMWRDLEM